MDNDVSVWFRIDDVWTDVTRINDRARVLAGDGEPGITMSSEVGGTRKITFRYLDSVGLLDGENPASPYYRKVGPGTAVRVLCDGVTAQVGEIAADGIAPSWDDGARHDDGSVAVTVEVTCTDVIGRLQQNDPPLESALTRYYRDITLYGSYSLMHWYTFEEGASATRIEDLVGNRPLTGLAKYGNDDGPPGAARAMRQIYEARTAPNPDQSTNLQVNDLVPQLAPMIGTDWALEVCGKFPAAAIDTDTQPSLLVEWRTFGLSGYWQIRADHTTKCWELNFFNTTLSQFKITTAVVARDDEWHTIRIEVDHIGADFDVFMYVDGAIAGTFTPTGAQTSPPKSLFIYNAAAVDAAIRPSISHLTTWAGRFPIGAPNPLWSYEAMLGHEGDMVHERFSNLLTENDIDYSDGGQSDGYGEELGPQDELPLLEILKNASDSDASWWFSHRTSTSEIIRYALDALYNQAPAFMGEYRHLSTPFRPVPNDEIANVIKASNGGASDAGAEVEYRIPDDDWLHWTTEPPPAGAYPRPDTVRTNLQDAAGTRDVAAWRAHERAWREKRYTAVTYELHRDAFSADDIEAVRSLDLGSMIAQGTVGAPPWIPHYEVRGLVRAWTRTVGKQTDTWVIDTVPADIYEVMVTDTSGSTLAAEIDDNDTTAKVATSSGPAWAADTQKMDIGGEAVTVTGLTTMTPAYVGVGTPAHADNAAIAPALPAGMVADVGVSVFCWVSSRNPSVTLPSTLTGGWTAVLTGYSEHRLYHCYYYTGLTAPSITPSGGAAGDTISGVCFAFSGVTPHTDNTDGYGGVWPSVNSSAQNMAFAPAPVRTSRTYGLREQNAVHLLLAWKQDDWTSVAPPSNYTEIFDTSSTLGNDQGVWGAYRILTDPTAYPGTSVTVTGGASAISKTFVVALRPLQEATIVRGVAGPAATHVAGSEIHAWHMGVRAL